MKRSAFLKRCETLATTLGLAGLAGWLRQTRVDVEFAALLRARDKLPLKKSIVVKVARH